MCWKRWPVNSTHKMQYGIPSPDGHPDWNLLFVQSVGMSGQQSSGNAEMRPDQRRALEIVQTDIKRDEIS